MFLIGSVSTLLFNANPLLRFDGYYILQDLIEIPNLYTRASKYNLYLLKKYLLKQNNLNSPVTHESEKPWLAGYGLLALAYRIFITLVIAMFLASQYFILGVILAVWALVTMFVLPVYKATRFLLFDPSIATDRSRILKRSSLCLAAVLAIVCFLPITLYTKAEGIIWVPEQAQIYAETDGFVDSQFNHSGSYVEQDTPVITLSNTELEKRELVLLAKKSELKALYTGQRVTDPVQADQTAEELITLDADIEQLQFERQMQTLSTRTDGVLVFPQHQNMVGRYIKKGDPVAYVVNPDNLIVKLVVPQTKVGLFNKGIRDVKVRLADNVNRAVQASVIRQTPSGSHQLPSRALGAAGGGEIAVQTTDQSGVTAADKIFQVDHPGPGLNSASGNEQFTTRNGLHR